jgi:hypothetical protein
VGVTRNRSPAWPLSASSTRFFVLFARASAAEIAVSVRLIAIMLFPLGLHWGFTGASPGLQQIEPKPDEVK